MCSDCGKRLINLMLIRKIFYPLQTSNLNSMHASSHSYTYECLMNFDEFLCFKRERYISGLDAKLAEAVPIGSVPSHPTPTVYAIRTTLLRTV